MQVISGARFSPGQRRGTKPLTRAISSENVFTPEPQNRSVDSQVKNTAEPARIKYLRAALQLVGVTFIFGIYTLSAPPHSTAGNSRRGDRTGSPWARLVACARLV